MTYGSTRGTVSGISFSEAVLKGIAPDGGLFVPEQDVRFDSLEMAEMCEMSYRDLASYIFKKFATDFTDAQIEYCVDRAYGAGSRFDGPDPAPLHHLNDTLSILELWHGPTAAFKDMALQVLPAFMSVALKKKREQARRAERPEKIVILTATSGDTGKAALEGFRDNEDIDIIVFYPENGVSEMQKAQMVTQEGKNVKVVAVRGNFDDAQTGVKKIFADKEFEKAAAEYGYRLSSANSINFGRLLPQIVYYFHAYFALVKADRISMGTKINFAVPTGNFGNILAAYYASKAGLPVNRIICATNENSVVSDFIKTGAYDANRKFILTISPAMDILISSNLERLIYDMSGENAKTVSGLMLDLRENRCYNVDRATFSGIENMFWADSATEAETSETVAGVWDGYGYLVDPHTAVGIDVYDKYVISSGDLTPTVAVSTASPFKFNKSVAEAVVPPAARDEETGEFETLAKLSAYTGLSVPLPLRDLDKRPVLHKAVCSKEEMMFEVADFIDSRQNGK